MIDWQQIDTVLLDMDGTLLDLHFDNYFWQEYVPLTYAKREGISLEQAKVDLLPRFQSVEGTINWYCIDYWSRELDMDIALLKLEVDHLIAVFPNVLRFLERLKEQGKQRVLVTNAHQKSLSLKMEKTRLDGHLDVIVSAHSFGHAKEEQAFWQKLEAIVDFEPKRSLLIDDNLFALRSAKKYGIGHQLAVLNPDSKRGPKDCEEFAAIETFKQIMP